MERLINKWYKLDDKIRFFVIGCINAAISYIIFAFSLFILGNAHLQLCVALQWGISSVISYFNQKIFVFGTKGNYLHEYVKCCSTWLVSYIMNVLILEILVKFINAYIAQFISLLLVSVITYVLFKYYAFRSSLK